MRLDGDAALALEVHAVEHLRRHLARLQRAGDLEKTVGQRGLAVIDVGDDGKIADVRPDPGSDQSIIPDWRLRTTGSGRRSPKTRSPEPEAYLLLEGHEALR